MLKPEIQLLLFCSSQQPDLGRCDMIASLATTDAFNWELLFNCALAHGVAPLVYANLRRLQIPLPSTVEQEFKLFLLANMNNKERVYGQLRCALTSLNRENIDVMLVKGVVYDQVIYDSPYHTTFHDVDLVIKQGFAGLPQEQLDHLLQVLSPPMLEYDIFSHHDVDMNGMLPVSFDEIWERARPSQFRGEAVWLMAPVDLLLSACINSCRRRYFWLKSLLDISEIAGRFQETIDWEEFISLAHRYDCLSIVYTALRTAEQTLGCPLPAGFLNEFPISRSRKNLIDALIHLEMKRGTVFLITPLYGPKIFSHHVNRLLFLTYASYQWRQILKRGWNLLLQKYEPTRESKSSLKASA